MKLISIFIFLVLAALAGCDDEDQALETERHRREQAEQQAAEQERNRDFWLTTAAVMGIGGIGLLFFGAALGSQARKDATEQGEGDP